MAQNPKDPEKDLKELDPIGIETNNAAPHTNPLVSPTSSSSGNSIYDGHDDEKDRDPEKSKRLELTQIKSNATGISALSQLTEADQPKKRTLWERVNPLKRNPPPVPEVRGPSREHTAGFFSLVTFQWVTPMMQVYSAL